MGQATVPGLAPMSYRDSDNRSAIVIFCFARQHRGDTVSRDTTVRTKATIVYVVALRIPVYRALVMRTLAGENCSRLSFFLILCRWSLHRWHETISKHFHGICGYYSEAIWIRTLVKIVVCFALWISSVSRIRKNMVDKSKISNKCAGVIFVSCNETIFNWPCHQNYYCVFAFSREINTKTFGTFKRKVSGQVKYHTKYVIQKLYIRLYYE